MALAYLQLALKEIPNSNPIPPTLLSRELCTKLWVVNGKHVWVKNKAGILDYITSNISSSISRFLNLSIHSHSIHSINAEYLPYSAYRLWALNPRIQQWLKQTLSLPSENFLSLWEKEGKQFQYGVVSTGIYIWRT